MVSRPVGIQGHLQAVNIQSQNVLSRPVMMVIEKVIRNTLVASYQLDTNTPCINVHEFHMPSSRKEAIFMVNLEFLNPQLYAMTTLWL